MSSVQISHTGPGLQWGIKFSLPSLAPFLRGSVGKAFPLLLAEPIVWEGTS